MIMNHNETFKFIINCPTCPMSTYYEHIGHNYLKESCMDLPREGMTASCPQCMINYHGCAA
jgi:hypothetical protein